MKKFKWIPCLLSVCLGLLLSTDGLYENRIAFCQEEEEPIQTRPRPDMQQHPLGKEKAVNPQGHMQSDPVKNKKETIADDGEHGDRTQRSIRPVVPKQETIADDGRHGDGIQPSMRPAVSKQETIADDGKHGDGIQPSMRPAVPKQPPRPKSSDIR